MIQNVRIISGLMSFGPVPEPDDPIEQRLTISSSGRIWFSEYLFGHQWSSHMAIGRKCQMTIPKESTSLIVSLLKGFMTATHDDPLIVVDVGVWEMILTEADGHKQKLSGSMIGNVTVNGKNMTKLIQDMIPINGLKVFG